MIGLTISSITQPIHDSLVLHELALSKSLNMTLEETIKLISSLIQVVDIDKLDQSGHSAFFLALREDNMVVAKALLNCGANPLLPRYICRKPHAYKLYVEQIEQIN